MPQCSLGCIRQKETSGLQTGRSAVGVWCPTTWLPVWRKPFSSALLPCWTYERIRLWFWFPGFCLCFAAFSFCFRLLSNWPTLHQKQTYIRTECVIVCFIHVQHRGCALQCNNSRKHQSDLSIHLWFNNLPDDCLIYPEKVNQMFDSSCK